MTYPVVRVSNGLYNAVADGSHGVVLGYDGSNINICDDIITQLGFSQSDVVPPMASGVVDAVFTRYSEPYSTAMHVYIFVVTPSFYNFPRLNEMAGDWGLFIVSDEYVTREFIYSIYVSVITGCDFDDNYDHIRGSYTYI